MRTGLLLGLVLSLSACESATLPPRFSGDVYEYRLATQPPLVLRWPSGSTVRVYVAGSSVAGRDAALRTALRAGAIEWNRHALFGEYHLAETTELSAADVVLRWSDDPSPVDLSACPPAGVRAVTTFCALGGDVRNGLAVFPATAGDSGRVKMVVSISGSQYSIAGRVVALVTHELGHVLGIARHSEEPRDLMYGGELSTAVPSPRDLATIQLLYQMRPDVTP